MNAVPLTDDAPPLRSSLRATRAWKITLLLIPLLTALALFSIRRAQVAALAARSLPHDGAVPPFHLTDQTGQPFGLEQLRGKIWIADFVFTTCPGPCPMISSRMAEMQKPLANTDVHLVSVSVDPEKDTPEVLRGYAEQLHAQPGRWTFLTGDKHEIVKLSHDGFKLPLEQDDISNGGGPVHSTRMVLVDRAGEIRGYYDATAPDAVTKVLADATHLLREPAH